MRGWTYDDQLALMGLRGRTAQLKARAKYREHRVEARLKAEAATEAHMRRLQP